MLRTVRLATAATSAGWLRQPVWVLPCVRGLQLWHQRAGITGRSSSRLWRCASRRLTQGPPKAQMSVSTAAAAAAGAVVVYVTVPNRETGHKIADSLVENKLAACVNIIPGLESIYHWQGKINRDEELLLMIKSRESLVPQLTQHVKGLHPYEECEVISVPITGGSASYLQWVLDSTKAA